MSLTRHQTNQCLELPAVTLTLIIAFCRGPIVRLVWASLISCNMDLFLRERERHRDTERDRDRQRQTDRQTDRDRNVENVLQKFKHV